ncbi:hypothetical protein F5Y14DRAFT_8850 [Nemania sp. NC0429]|nr:hypothetical protein F5Y14DRAFT_8850 [Nemania sp. NC0429]
MFSENDDRLLPSLLDDLALSDPSRILYSFAKTKDPVDGFTDVCAADFARAVDRCAWFIDQTLGPGKGFPALVYMGPQDLNYAIVVLASIKTGYKALLVSPRNTLDAHVSLLEKTECNTFLTPPNFPLPVVKQILAARPMRHVEVAGFHYWLGDGDVGAKPYPYAKTFSEAKGEPFVVLHTSGSTGIPKPIVQTHGTASALCAFSNTDRQTSLPAGLRGKRVYLTFPLFHCAGISVILPVCLSSGCTVVLAAFPPSADVVNGVHLFGNVQHTILVPATLESLVKNPDYLDNLSRLEQITYGGGPVSKAVGDLVITKTRLLNCLGSTECGALPATLPDDPRDWQYLRLPSNLGYEYRHVSDNLYEQVMVRDEDRLRYQGIFATFPDLAEWPMRDIYERHPDPAKGDLWLYRGRVDDIIVFSTGEKINPNEMEDIINRNPAVNACLIAGQGRFQSSLLVEAVDAPVNAEDERRLLEVIWPSVQAANKECPSHGVIHRHMIAFTNAARPMLRAGKGTVQRRLTLELYASELASLYDAANEPAGQRSMGGVDGSYDNIEAAVKAILASSTKINAHSVAPDGDLFELGLDSLQVTTIVRKLNELIAHHGQSQSVIAPKTVYANPTLSTLTEAVSVVINGRESAAGSWQETLEQLYRLHSANMPISGRPAAAKSSAPTVVLMTGSTGSVGTYILDVLQRDTRVSRVYCLSRGPDSRRRQESLQAARGLQPLSATKTHCLDADLSKSHFGLPTTGAYRDLLAQVTHVIHAAWQVDFNRSAASFAGHVGFVRRLVDFSSHSRLGAALFFVSSVAAVAGLRGRVAEEVYADWATPGGGGYGQSKFVSERLLDAAAREAGVPSTICRVGQVAGPTTAKAGEWPRREWLPSLIASSVYLGKIPESLGPRLDVVDWIPVDKLGEAIVELAMHPPDPPQEQEQETELGPEDTGATVYHAVNPNRTTWGELLPTIAQHLGRKKVVEIVSLATWVDALRESVSETDDLTANPAVKLLDFFESLADASGALLSTERTLAASPTLSAVGPVRDEWMENWMRQWGL